MGARDRNLFEQIEQDALDDDVPLASILRKVIALGGNVGSTELREWASRELKGYDKPDDVPDYRRPAAAIKADAVIGSPPAQLHEAV